MMLLRIGSKGEDVENLQEALGLNVDGFFGATTEKAVKEWQAKNGLAIDGIVRTIAWTKLLGKIHPTSYGIDLSNMILKLSNTLPINVVDEIPLCAEKFQINTPLRVAHFLAQCAHESINFKFTEENLNYSEKSLKAMFPEHFQGAMASLYAKKPEKIANRIYANKMGNRNELSGDGYLFRGRGYLRLTGCHHYIAFNDSLSNQDVNLLSNPDLVATSIPLLSAAWLWDARLLNTLADRGADRSIVVAITKKIKSKTLSLNDRINQFKALYSLLA